MMRWLVSALVVMLVSCAHDSGRNTPAVSSTLHAEGKYSGAWIVVDRTGPVIVSLDDSRLTLTDCADPQCRSADSRVIAPGGEGGYALWRSRAGIVIAWLDVPHDALRIRTCPDRACAKYTETSVTPFPYDRWSIAPDGDDVVILAVREERPPVRLRCRNMDCAATDITSVGAADAGVTSTAGDGMWMFSIPYEEQGDVEVVRCDESNCSRADLETSEENEDWTPIQVAAPFDSRHDAWAAVLRTRQSERSRQPLQKFVLIRCRDGACAEQIERAVIGANYLDMSMLSDGSPVVAFTESRDETLHVAVCQDPDCRQMSINNVGFGWVRAVTVDPEDRPVLVTGTETDGVLRLDRCMDRNCATVQSSIVDTRP